MRSATHGFFSVGVGLFTASAIHLYLPLSLLLGAWLGACIGFVIDILGHSPRGNRQVRSWVTHSLVTAPLWGVLLGVATTFVLTNPLPPMSMNPLLELSIVLGIVAAYSHLLLDALTEGGVYGVGRRRVALAHFGNDNLLLNWSFILLGIVLASAGLGLL
jgi:hypothetical protein